MKVIPFADGKTVLEGEGEAIDIHLNNARDRVIVTMTDDIDDGMVVSLTYEDAIALKQALTVALRYMGGGLEPRSWELGAKEATS